MFLPVDKATERIEEDKSVLQGQIEKLREKGQEYQQILSDLKVQLYAKFGNNINLEADDDS